MKHSEFWLRMEHHLGPGYARVWAHEQALAQLDGRSVEAALADGVAPQQVWRAVWRVLELPESER